MKRSTRMNGWFALALAALLLFGCVPTPTQEYVVNRGDGMLEQTLNESPVAGDGAEAGRTVFPDRWQTAFETRDGIPVTVDACVEQKADGVYPVWRTRYAPLTAADAARYCAALLPAPVSVSSDEPTKAELTEQFRAFLDEAERLRSTPEGGKDGALFGWSEDEIEARTASYIEAIDAAPAEKPETPVSDFRNITPNETHRFKLSDGGSAEVTWRESGITLYRGGTLVYNEKRYEEDLRLEEDAAKAWREPTLSRPDAEAALHAALSALDLGDFAVCKAYRADLMRGWPDPIVTETGWQFLLYRDYGGYPMEWNVHPAERFSYGGDAAVSRPIDAEYIDVFVAADGVRAFWYGTPKQVRGLVTPNVALLPFDRVALIAENALKAGLAASGRERFEVYRALLTVFTVQEKDSADYLELPCWVFYYDSGVEWLRFSPNAEHPALLLNAVDGSIVRTVRAGQPGAGN